MKLSPPGSVGGPCLEPCRHEQCVWKRALARKLCKRCSRPVGYDLGLEWDDETDDVRHITCPT